MGSRDKQAPSSSPEAAASQQPTAYAEGAEAKARSPRPTLPLKRVMIVEDDAVVRLLLSTQLSAKGIDVKVHESPVDALADSELWDVNLLICDIDLPSLSGVEVIRRVRAARPSLPLLAISGLRDPQVLSDAVRAGAFDLLVKPLSGDDILQHLREIDESPVPAHTIGSRLENSPYIIDDVIGRGGSGVVYRALHAELGRRCALKILMPDALGGDTVESVLNEARTLARLRGPNFVDVYDLFFLEDGRIVYVMEYLRGSTLRDRITVGRRIDPEAAIDIVHNVGLALGDAHRAGVMHLDIKPENIFLCEREPGRAVGWDRRVRVLDFGLSSMVGVGKVSGFSEGWSPPEQVAGGRCTPASDVYGLGLVYKELLGTLTPTQREVFGGPKLGRLEAWIDRCTTSAPSARFGTGDEAALALALARA